MHPPSGHLPRPTRLRRARRALGLALAATLALGAHAASPPTPRPPAAPSPSQNSALAAWLHSQTNLASWSAEFTQIRSLRSLKTPLVSHGSVWFAAPGSFRWEITNPAPTIALRLSNQVAILYPNLRRIEQFPLDSATSGPWKDALAILDAGFPRSLQDLEKRFRILPPQRPSASLATNSLPSLRLEPRSPSAKKWLPEIEIEFDPSQPGLHSTRIQFSDGSSLHNIFSNSVVNPSLSPSLFELPKDGSYQIVSPQKPKAPAAAAPAPRP